jgi:hypothetical protein
VQARQVLYHLSYAPSPFVCTLFLRQGSLPLSRLALNLRPFCLCLPSSWDYRFIGVCQHAIMLAGQMLYHLIHIPSPFWFRYFSKSPPIYAWASLDYDSCTAGMIGMERLTCTTKLSFYWLLVNFLPGLALNLDPLDLYLPRRWDYGHVPSCWPGTHFFCMGPC